MKPNGIEVCRPLSTISPQVATLPKILPSDITTPDYQANTILDSRILKLGGYVDLSIIEFDQYLHVPRQIAFNGAGRNDNGILVLTPLQSAFNELVRVLCDPDPGITKVQRRSMVEDMLANLRMIATQDFKRVALTETVRFRVPGALKVAVVDERLQAGEIGLSSMSIRKMFGGKRFQPVALVGRYPTFAYLPAKVNTLHDVGEAIAVSPDWLRLKGTDDKPRTFLDMLEGDTDGDLLSIIPAPNAECAEEILAGIPDWEFVPHSEIVTPIPSLSDLQKEVGDHLRAAIGKMAAKVYIPHIISAQYRSWVVFNICEKQGVDTSLTRPEITTFWKVVSEGVFDLKHGTDGLSAVEDILQAFSGRKSYEEIVDFICAIEKMPVDGMVIGRRIWEMPRLLGEALGENVITGDLPKAASICRTWHTLEDSLPNDIDSGLTQAVHDLVSDFGIESLGDRMLSDIYELYESEVR